MLKNYKITLSSFMASKYFMNDDVLILRLPEEFPFNKCGETIIQLSEKKSSLHALPTNYKYSSLL